MSAGQARAPIPAQTDVLLDDRGSHLHFEGGGGGDPSSWVVELPPAGRTGEEAGSCPICLCEVDADRVKLKGCGHVMHSFCAAQALSRKPECPVCRRKFAEIRGDSPPGTFTVKEIPYACAGYDGFSTLEITMVVNGGIQSARHPRPGRPFTGTYRIAYVPATREGRELVPLLRLAFDRGLVFTVGTSLTTGASDTVVWAGGIHFKTNMTGGVGAHGFPDPTYFARVREELKERGIE